MCEYGLGNSSRNIVKEDDSVFLSFGRAFYRPDRAPFGEEHLSPAEKTAEEVLHSIHPTLDSEERRRDVVDHLQKLIKSHINCEVFPYGSVPLKTYLLDGDIDLTVLKGPNARESLAHDVLAVLSGEDQNENAEFQIKDTQFIDAEVKLVKCVVQNIVVDISFNQLGGLSTLCFLEQVNRVVGRNHLFKRSIILIKAWCFYESRILGATHGLISTYALETLILYIFQLFHSSLTGPLAALHRFLDYFSKFDWDSYCISLKGPVCKSSLPKLVVKTPNDGPTDLLLGEEFMENCMEMLSVPFRWLKDNQKAFQLKHLNIIDPLKEYNNLGRSVHRGNFFRIRSAFKFGACKLGRILSLPEDQVADEINKFFANTISRHRKHSSSSVEHVLEFGDDVSSSIECSSSRVDLFSDDDLLIKYSVNDFDDDSVGIFENEVDRCLAREVYSDTASETCYSADEVVISYNPGTTTSCLKNGMPNYFSNIKKSVFEKMELSSKGGESEAIDSLADLSGDYESHIRSFLYGQLNHGFTSSVFVCSNPAPLPSRILNKKRFDTFHPSILLTPNHIFHMNLYPTSSTGCHSIYSAAESATTFHPVGNPNVRGSGTYFPPANGFYRERPSQGRGRSKATGNRNQFNGYNHSSGVHAAFNRSNSFENSSHEVVSVQNKSQGQSGFSSGDGNQSNSYLSSLCRIEFGSKGNLAEEVMSGSSHVRGSNLCGFSGNKVLNCNSKAKEVCNRP